MIGFYGPEGDAALRPALAAAAKAAAGSTIRFVIGDVEGNDQALKYFGLDPAGAPKGENGARAAALRVWGACPHCPSVRGVRSPHPACLRPRPARLSPPESA